MFFIIFTFSAEFRTQNAPHKPCLSDFPGFRRHIASNAIPDLVATIITEGPYELTGTVSKWAGKSYGRRWTEEIPNEPFQAAPRALLGIVSPLLLHGLPLANGS